MTVTEIDDGVLGVGIVANDRREGEEEIAIAISIYRLRRSGR